MEQDLLAMLNDQINLEFSSAYLYHAIEMKFSQVGLEGYAKWYKAQADEEAGHARRIEYFLLDCDEEITLSPISNPETLPDDPKDLLKLALMHERKVTSCVHTICIEAIRQKNLPVMQFMDWFVKEQVEEEKNAKNNMMLYDNYVGCGSGLMDADQEMGRQAS